MKFQLGAMTVGDILDRGLKVLLARLPAFYAINVVVLLPLIAIELAMPAMTYGDGTSGGGSAPVLLLGTLGLIVLGLILQPLGTAAILHLISKEFVDERASVGEACQFAFRRFGPLLLSSMMAGIAIGFGTMLLIIPGIILAIWYIFVAQVVVVESLKGGAALSRSKELTEGYRGRVFGMFVLFLVVNLVFVYAISFLDRAYPSFEQVRTDEGVKVVHHFGRTALKTGAARLVGILVQTYSAVCFTLMYFDLRIRKEGFDLEMAAKQQSIELS
jgi:hypothetical protein